MLDLPISGVVLARNEAATVGFTLSSLKKVCDELIFVDGSSTDGTTELAMRYATKLCRREPKAIVELERMFALSEASKEWVIYLDGDELLSKELSSHVRSLAQDDAVSADGVLELPIYKGRVIRWGYYKANYQTRFYRKAAVTYKGILHELPEVQGLTKYIDFPILHFTKEPWNPIPQRTKRWMKIEAMQTKLKASRTKYLLYSFVDVGKNLYSFFVTNKAYRDGVVGVEMHLKLILCLFMRKFYRAALSKREGK